MRTGEDESRTIIIAEPLELPTGLPRPAPMLEPTRRAAPEPIAEPVEVP